MDSIILAPLQRHIVTEEIQNEGVQMDAAVKLLRDDVEK